MHLIVRSALPRTQVKVTNVNIASQKCCVVIKSNADLQIFTRNQLEYDAHKKLTFIKKQFYHQ